MIYFAQSPEGGPIKIGFSRNPEQRIQAFSGGLKLLAVCPGEIVDEHALHELLSDHRLEGEWFADVEEVRSAIDAATVCSSIVGTKDETAAIAAGTFGLAMKMAFGDGPEAYRAITAAAQISTSNAKRWLAGKNLPGSYQMARLAASSPVIRHWQDGQIAAHALSKQESISFAEAYARVLQHPDDVAAWVRAPITTCGHCGRGSRPDLTLSMQTPPGEAM